MMRSAWSLLGAALMTALPTASFAVCGDGIFEPIFEYCDDGAANGANGCCTTECQFVDSDVDSVCDALDPCPSPASATVDDIRLKVTGANEPPGEQTLRFRASVTLPEPLDPPSTGLRLVVSWLFFRGIALDLSMPAGAGWTTSPSTWRYRDPSGLLDASVRHFDSTGATRVAVRSRRGAYALTQDTFPAKVSLAFAPGVPTAEQCGEAWVGPGLCTTNGSGSVLSCIPPRSLRVCSGDPSALVRCDLQNAARAQEAQFAVTGDYIAGACTSIPGFVPSPFVTCTTTGDRVEFMVMTAHPSLLFVLCRWESNPAPGARQMVCGQL